MCNLSLCYGKYPEIFLKLFLSFASSVTMFSWGSCRIDILLPTNRLLYSSFGFSVTVNNLDSCTALVCASLSNLKKDILLFCLVNTFIAVSCDTVYCSAEEFTWIFRFCLPVHALLMPPYTFPLGWHFPCCLLLVRAITPVKLPLDEVGFFPSRQIIITYKKKINSCMV